MSRRESVGRLSARTQSASGPPSKDMVSVAVLPPRLKGGMAPPTGLGPAEAFSWDESLNWQHNDPIEEKDVGKAKGFLRKTGITTQRKKANPDLPPFVLRQIPYDTWRKHYAKDKDGNYHGTHAPAEDCLLKPHDVEKWRLGDPVTKGDRWTRGKEALPVYAEVNETAAVPEYEHDYDGPPRSDPPTHGMPDSVTLEPEDDQLASHLEKRSSRLTSTSSGGSQPQRNTSTASVPMPVNERPANRQIIANGKTAQEIIAEAGSKGKPKLGWKARAKRAGEYAMMGGGNG